MKWIVDNENMDKNFTDKLLCQEIRKQRSDVRDKGFILTGSRSLNGLKYIASNVPIESYGIVYIDAPFNLLKENYEAREKLSLPDDDFNKILIAERKMGLKTIKEYAKVQPDNCYYFYKLANHDLPATLLGKTIFQKEK
jgi:hypothetical protein